MPKTQAEIWGLGEIAAHYGVSSQLVNEWTKAKRFPAPRQTLTQGRIWNRSDIDRWARRYRPELAGEGGGR